MMKKSITITLLSLALIIVACDGSEKPSKQKNTKELIANLDSDKDGRISFEESMSPRKKKFSEFDTSQDGFIQESEIISKKKVDNNRKFNKLDSDDDNRITMGEWMTPLEKKFKIKDRNQDGFITEEELKKIIYSRKKITNIDTDKDGKISFEEWMSKRKKRFSKFDKDNDGVIQKDEMKSKKIPGSGGRFRKLDADDDNRVTIEEWLAPSEKKFKKKDSNQDGFLAENELTAKTSK